MSSQGGRGSHRFEAPEKVAAIGGCSNGICGVSHRELLIDGDAQKLGATNQLECVRAEGDCLLRTLVLSKADMHGHFFDNVDGNIVGFRPVLEFGDGSL